MNKRIALFLIATLATTASAEGPATVPSTVEKTISGEYVALIPAHPTPNFRMVPSPNYRRIAMTETFPPKNRWYIAVDDRVWEFYDLVDAKSLQFSPDSKHVACAALRDGSWRIIVDNAEQPIVLPRRPSELRFTGNALSYIARGETAARAVIAGKPQPLFDDVEKLAVTEDTAHFAYIATRGKQTLIVTDTATCETPEVLAPPVLTEGGKHIRWLAAATQDNHAAISLIEDGKPLSTTKLTGKLRRASISPDGLHTAIVQTADAGGHLERISVDGEDHPVHCQSIDRLTWSPNGQLAYVATITPIVTPANGPEVTVPTSAEPVQYLVVAGNQDTQHYSHIYNNLQFTDGGKQIAFHASDNPGPFAVPRPWYESPLPPRQYRWNLTTRSSQQALWWNESAIDRTEMIRSGTVISAYDTDTPWGDVISAKADGSHKTHALVAAPAGISVNDKPMMEVKLYAIEKESDK